VALHKLSVVNKEAATIVTVNGVAKDLVGEEVKTWRHGEFRGTAVSNSRLLVEHKGAI
jgi:hypothetical protein